MDGLAEADDGRTLPVINPATGELIALVPDAGAAETRRAIAAAEQAMASLEGADGRAPGRVCCAAGST
jgi:acyl-CoA reductase-like NAD-dependent aldehyde dehydrogenase